LRWADHSSKESSRLQNNNETENQRPRPKGAVESVKKRICCLATAVVPLFVSRSLPTNGSIRLQYIHTIDLVHNGSTPNFTVLQVISAFSSLEHKGCISVIKPSELKLEKGPYFSVSCVHLFMLKPVYLLCMFHKMRREVHR
jgi:hypothetical protein